MLWPFDINWNKPVVERLAWLTDVLISKNDTEQCMRLRAGARRTLRFSTLVGTDAERVLYENTVIAGQADLYQLPVWIDAARVTDDIGSLDIAIAVDSTLNKAFEVGASVVLVNGLQTITATVSAIAAQQVMVTGPVGVWPPGTKLVPLLNARLRNQQPLSYITDAVLEAEVTFQFDDEWLGTPAVEAADYLGYPVFLERTEWSEDVSSTVSRNLAAFDNQVGRLDVFDIAGVARTERSHRWVLGSRAETAALKGWLAARAGRLNPFWAPSNQHDFAVQNTIAALATTIDVDNRGHASVATEIGRRDIMIELKSGTRFYRRITGVAITDSDTETVTIDAALGIDVVPGDISRVCYMRLRRLASDAVEIAHRTDEVAVVGVAFTGKRDIDA